MFLTSGIIMLFWPAEIFECDFLFTDHLRKYCVIVKKYGHANLVNAIILVF